MPTIAIAIAPIVRNPTPRLPMTTIATPTTRGESDNKTGKTGNAAYLLTHTCTRTSEAPTPEKIGTHAAHSIPSTSSARIPAIKSAKPAIPSAMLIIARSLAVVNEQKR